MMNRSEVLCVCALKLGDTISGSTLGALSGIDILVSTLPCCDENREVSININRATSQHYAKKLAAKYKAVILIDGDVVASKESIDALLDNYDVNGCVAVRTKPFDGDRHFYCSLCIMPIEKYLNIVYWGTSVCQCNIVRKKMNVKYVEGVSVEEM